MSLSNKKQKKNTDIVKIADQKRVAVGSRSDGALVVLVAFRNGKPLFDVAENIREASENADYTVEMLEKFLGDEVELDYDLIDTLNQDNF